MRYTDIHTSQSLRIFNERLSPFFSLDLDEDAVQPYNFVASSDEEVRSAYQVIIDMVDVVKDELGRGLKRAASKEDKVVIDVKKLDSFKDKVLNRGKDVNSISDVLRSSVVVNDKSMLDKVASKLSKIFKVKDHEFKEFKQTGDFGYFGSHHFLVELSNGIIAEIQVLTKRLWNYKKEAGKIYTKWRSAIPTIDEWGDDMIDEFNKDMARSRRLFKRGNTNIKSKKPPIRDRRQGV